MSNRAEILAEIEAARSDESSPWIPYAGLGDGQYSKDGEATATCYCGDVQLAFPTESPGLVGTFICHCTDCRKITASLFTAAFTILDSHLKHLRGQDKLKTYGQNKTIGSPISGHLMTNYFCSTCGTLMYRVGSALPGLSLLRLGTVDDFNLVETKLLPQVEQFTEYRAKCLKGPVVSSAKQVLGSPF